MRVLILDDEKYRHEVFAAEYDAEHAVYHAYTYEEFVSLLDSDYDVIFLDHDLGSEATGVDAAKALVDSGRKPRMVIIHSLNPSGASKIRAHLTDNNYKCALAPFSIPLPVKLENK